jgi:amino acid transporter
MTTTDTTNTTDTTDITDTTEDKSKTADKGGITPTLNLTDLTLLGLGNVIGAGIFVILGKTVLYGGRDILPIFLLVALISIIMGFCYLEIYARYQSEIMEYLSVKDIFGEWVGQSMIYLLYFFTVFSGITITISLTKYITNSGYFHLPKLSTFVQVCISVFLIAIMCLITYAGIEASTMFANTIGVTLLILLCGIIILSLTSFDLGKIEHGPSKSLHSIVLSTIVAFFLFNGYDALVKMSADAINPGDVATAMGLTLGITSIIYILIIISCLSVIGYKTTATSFLPLSRMYDALIGRNMGFISFVCGFFIMFNTAFLSILTATRFMYGCGKSKNIAFADFWGQLNSNKTPSNAIAITFVIGVLLACLNNEVLLSVFSNSAVMIILIILCMTVLALRWKERNSPELIKKNNYIYGNIDNIPVIVVIELIVLIALFAVILKNKFYIGKT